MRTDDKFIIDVSIALEPFFNEIDWELMEKKFDLTGSIGMYNNHNVYYYEESMERIVNNSFNLNSKKSIEMLEYLCYKYNIDFDFTDIKDYINLEEKNIGIEFPKNDFQHFRVFISYSSKDYEEANRIYNIFKNADIHCFLASQEIKLGENWDEKIFEELIKADIFIFLLSESYKKSFWCNQESSIGYLKREIDNSLIIPLLTDDTVPYGIFYSVQGINSKKIKNLQDLSKFIDSGSVSFNNALNLEHEHKLKEIDDLIEELCNVTNYYDSNKIFDKIKFIKLDLYQVKNIFDYAILNNQISGSFGFNSFLKKYYPKYQNELDSKRYVKIKLWYKQCFEDYGINNVLRIKHE